MSAELYGRILWLVKFRFLFQLSYLSSLTLWLVQFLFSVSVKLFKLVEFLIGPYFFSAELFKLFGSLISPILFYFSAELFKLFEPLIGAKCIQYANKLDGRTRRNTYDAVFSHDALKSYYETFQSVSIYHRAHRLTQYHSKQLWLLKLKDLKCLTYVSLVILFYFSSSFSDSHFV